PPPARHPSARPYSRNAPPPSGPSHAFLCPRRPSSKVAAEPSAETEPGRQNSSVHRTHLIMENNGRVGWKVPYCRRNRPIRDKAMLRLARWLLLIPVVLILFLLGPLLTVATGAVTIGGDWRTASRNPVGLAPDPAVTPEAVLQVYAARAFSWRAAFAVHSWIAVKPAGAPSYTVYEVNGWRRYRGLPPLLANDRPPDAEWFGHRPELLLDLRGEGVDKLIERVTQAAG